MTSRKTYKNIALDQDLEIWLKNHMESILPDPHAIKILSKIQGRSK